jgi:hypothetical protein
VACASGVEDEGVEVAAAPVAQSALTYGWCPTQARRPV